MTTTDSFTYSEPSARSVSRRTNDQPNCEDTPVVTDGRNLIDQLLREQQQTTAVEKFAQWHQDESLPLLERHYHDLVPVSEPKPGEQYAFEVDLDACSGCKACVAACHNLNGLAEEEVWRSVGFLHGGTSELPVVQHVTTACHHCVEPACLGGCPVEAYEKDVQTGIVRHLDDQCIGCQYCTLKCPYDVPKYNSKLGIVRKCDMCHDRLTNGEAPACVQACPNKAIRIKVVNKEAVIDESEANMFLPGAPEPSYTLPTTTYKTSRSLPRNLLPGDYFSARRQHAHWPLLIMLVLTQMSVGAFLVEQLLSNLVDWTAGGKLGNVRTVHLVSALVLGLIGMNAAVFHLGRPLYAFRAWIGLRTSWLSREMLGFGLFAAMASVYVGAEFAGLIGINVSSSIRLMLGLLAASTGLVGIFCSVMIYVDTRRAFWSATQTNLKFFGTALILGIPVSLMIAFSTALLTADLSIADIMNQFGTHLCKALILVTSAKLVFECTIFSHLRERSFTSLKRTAQLMTGDLKPVTLQRFVFGVIGGILIPAIMIAQHELFSTSQIAACLSTLLMFSLLTAGEVMERYLFFTAVVAPKMPGAPAT